MDKKRMCTIVEDLLPSYLDGLTNDTTNEMIEEHIKVCESCSEHKQTLLDNNEQLLTTEKDKSNVFKKTLSRYRYQLLGLMLGVIFTIVAVCGCFAFAIFRLNMQSKIDSHTHEVEEYRKFDDYYGISKLYLFPKASVKTAEDVTIRQYWYDIEGNKVYPNCQIFLECEYTKEAYEQEQKRLMEVSDSDTKLAVIYDETEFPYPAVYAMKGSENCYEYVLFLEEERKMIYVYLQGGIDRRELLFSDDYLPNDYGQYGYSFEEEGYSIYACDSNEY